MCCVCVHVCEHVCVCMCVLHVVSACVCMHVWVHVNAMYARVHGLQCPLVKRLYTCVLNVTMYICMCDACWPACICIQLLRPKISPVELRMVSAIAKLYSYQLTNKAQTKSSRIQKYMHTKSVRPSGQINNAHKRQ